MANRVPAPNLFNANSPNWSLALLDANASNATGAINDSSLGSANGPLTDTGSVNAYSVSCTFGSPSAYNNGMTVFFTPANTNTGASTLTVAPLSSLPIQTSSGAALTGGELVAGATVGLVCTGTAFQIFSSPGASQIWSVRLRSFNAIGNPNFEVDQRNVGNAVANIASGALWQDRWGVIKSGTMQAAAQQNQNASIIVPGTNFLISQAQSAVGVTTTEPTLAAGDYFAINQNIEGPQWRELANDVTSISLLVYAPAPNFKFAVSLRNGAATNSLVKLCTVPTANTWTLITLPNIPKPTAGSFPLAPGGIAAQFSICLACGTTLTAPATDTWQSGNFIGASGMSNLFATASATFYLGFVQLEPGPVCTTLIDKPFTQNLDECLRYYAKSYDYGVKPGTNTGAYGPAFIAMAGAANWALGNAEFPKIMAKAPAVSIWGNDGTLSAATLFGGANAALSGVSANAKRIYAINFGANQTAGQAFNFNYAADTGW